MAVIGIDLGTTNSLAAYWKDGRAEVLSCDGTTMFPSVVSMEDDGSVIVGKLAKERQILHKECTVGSFKCFMGTGKKWLLGEKEYGPVELSALVLGKIKAEVQKELGEEIEEAVITVPAYFNDKQRSDTKQAAKLAGLNVKRLINEPSAAALAYQMVSGEKEHNLLVFDFGGGTLDLSLVECFDNVIEIIGVTGDNHLGGDDIDKAIEEEFCRENNICLQQLPLSEQQSIRKQAAKMKIDMSDGGEADMSVRIGGKDVNMHFTQERLFEVCSILFEKIKNLFLQILRDADYRISDIDDLIMVGGSSKLLIVQQFLTELLGKQPIVPEHTDEAVALGVGIYAGIRARKEDVKDIVMTDVCPFTLGVDVVNNANDHKPHMLPMIRRNATLPASYTNRLTTLSDYQQIMSIEVYQGEEYYVEDNLRLGKLDIVLPRRKAGEAVVNVTFRYDINGILQVEAENDEGEKRKLTFLNEGLDKQEKKEYLEELEKIRIQSEIEEKIQILEERAKALYVQGNHQEKEYIAYLLNWFLRCRESNRRFLLKRAVVEMESELQKLESRKIHEDTWFFDGKDRLDGIWDEQGNELE